MLRQRLRAAYVAVLGSLMIMLVFALWIAAFICTALMPWRWQAPRRWR